MKGSRYLKLKSNRHQGILKGTKLRDIYDTWSETEDKARTLKSPLWWILKLGRGKHERFYYCDTIAWFRLGWFSGEGNGYPLQYSCLEKMPWTEESYWLQSMGSRRVRHNWANNFHFLHFLYYRENSILERFICRNAEAELERNKYWYRSLMNSSKKLRS